MGNIYVLMYLFLTNIQFDGKQLYCESIYRYG